MSFRKLNFSDFEKPEIHRDNLPEQKRFDLLEEAFLAYSPWIQDPNIKLVSPRILPPDMIRLLERISQQFATDWPQIFDIANDNERLYCVLAYLHLRGLCQAWIFFDSSTEASPASIAGHKFLQEAVLVRNQLLALAEVAYEGIPPIKTQIQHIRSAHKKSQYDELAEDLAATVALFASNKFTATNEVIYPEKRLEKATELANQLPLFSPKHASRMSGRTKKIPVGHRPFSVMMAAVYHLVGWGRFVHFPQDVSSYRLRIFQPRKPAKTSKNK